MVDKLYHRANPRSSFRLITRFVVEIQCFVCNRATPPIIEKLRSEGINCYARVWCFRILHVNQKSIKWPWAGLFEISVKIEQGSIFVVQNDSRLFFIALNKNPGVRPISIGDTARRIIAKAILNIIRQDVQEAAGSVQLCAGQISGIEAVVHAVRTLLQSDETEALLLVDASNAFNSLNRQTALHNIQRLCPSLATALINTYRSPSELYVDGDVLLSEEGTTQGDPLAMPMYALATIPLIRKLKDNVNDVSQVWYAHDASGAGKVNRLREWWDQMNTLGPKYRYFTNPSKTWLVTKNCHSSAVAAFADTDVKVTSDGRPYLGVALGTEEYMQAFVT